MMDDITTIAMLKQKFNAFCTERDWMQYETPKNLSMNLVREASELMEIFTWLTPEDAQKEVERRRSDVEDELADVAFSLILFCERIGVDLTQAIEKKMVKNAQKYPVQLCKGKSEKYTEYETKEVCKK